MKNMEQVEAVTRMQNYISKNLQNNLTLNSIAKAAGYSPWHSAKLFKEYTGKTPFEYIRMLRLTEAAKSLQKDNIRIIDVALDFYFSSHDGFTRAFSKEFGINPKKYTRSKPPIKMFMPHPVSDYYKMIMKGEVKMSKENATTIFTQVVEKPERKLILKRGIEAEEYFKYCDEVGCDVWGILSSITEAISEPMGLWLPNKLIEKGTSKYVQGVEVSKDFNGVIPDGFAIINLEPCKIMIFQGETYDDENFAEEIGIVKKAIEKYNPKLYGFEWDDDSAPRFQYEPQGDRGYIEGRPVKSINE